MTDVAAAPDTELDQCHVFVMRDEQGREQVPFIRMKDGMVLPMFAVDVEQMGFLTQQAAELHAQTGKPVEVLRFTGREHVAWIGQPADGEDTVEEAPAPKVHCPGCGLQLHGSIAERGGCLGCYPKDEDLPVGG